MSGSEELAGRAVPSSSRVRGNVSGDVLIVGICAVFASGLGRSIAPALPGVRAGMDGLIARLDWVAAFLTQFVVVLGIATAARLLLLSMQYRLRLFRPVAVLSCAVVFPLVVAASSHRLEFIWLLAMLGGSALIATAAAGPALRLPSSRIAGLVLGMATAASIVGAAGKVLGLSASRLGHAALFERARAVASVGLALEVMMVVAVALWLVGKERRMGVAVLAVLLLSAAAAWAGLQGDSNTAWRIFAARALSSLSTHPDPYFGAAVRYTVQVGTVLMAGLTLAHQRWSAAGQSVAFSLLASASGDIPLCGLMLVLAALLAVRASQSAPATPVRRLTSSPA